MRSTSLHLLMPSCQQGKDSHTNGKKTKQKVNPQERGPVVAICSTHSLLLQEEEKYRRTKARNATRHGVPRVRHTKPSCGDGHEWGTRGTGETVHASAAISGTFQHERLGERWLPWACSPAARPTANCALSKHTSGANRYSSLCRKRRTRVQRHTDTLVLGHRRAQHHNYVPHPRTHSHTQRVWQSNNSKEGDPPTTKRN